MPRTPVPPDNGQNDAVNKLLSPTVDPVALNVTRRRYGRGLIYLDDYRLMDQITRLYELGEPRILYELIDEIGAATMCRSEVDNIVAKFDSAFCVRKPRR
jgi:hypothetical protein